jgi:hypothetical protein
MNIKETIATINQMQADGIIDTYALGGAVGATFYLEPTNTVDVDVFVLLKPKPGQLVVSLEDIYSYLEAKGCSVNRHGYSIIGGWQVQFLPADKPLLLEALKESVEQDLDGLPVRVFTAAHLAVVAFELGRAKDKIRLFQFLDSKSFDEQKFSDILSRHGLLDRWDRFKRQMLG